MTAVPLEVFAETLATVARRATGGALMTESHTKRLDRGDVMALDAALAGARWTVTLDRHDEIATIAFGHGEAPILTLAIERGGVVRTAGSAIAFAVDDPARLTRWLADRGVGDDARTGREAPRDAPHPGTAIAAPAGADLLGVARYGVLRALGCDATHACAFDGFTLRCFGPGAPLHAGTPVARVTAAAVHDGRVYLERDGVVQVDVRTGAIERAPSRGFVRTLVHRSGHAASSWKTEVARLFAEHAGEPPGDAWLVAEPTPNDFAAHDAFGHLGVPAPLALSRPHLWVCKHGEHVLRGWPRQGRWQPRSVDLEHPIVALTAAADGVRGVTRSGDALARVDVDDRGRAEARGAALPGTLSSFAVRAMGDDLLVHATARDDVLLLWRR